ncbi:hypothetical protein LXL04_027326 [Taraxacum kok-saghyz]
MNKNRQTDLHSPRLDFVHSEICTAHSHSILARKRKLISTSMKSIRIRNKGGYPINTPTWTDFGRRKEKEIGGAVAQMKASRRSDGSGGVLERRFGGDGRRFSSPTASAMVELPTPAAMENGGRCRSVVPHEQERPGMGIAAVVGCGSGREGGEGRRWQR